MHFLINNVLDTITEHNLIEPDDAVFVAFSGGADSVFLLHTLLMLRNKLGYRSITALHLHHGLRGEEADRDEQFVREYCQNHGVSLTVVHADVAALAADERLSLEEAGRRVRYECFAKLREQLNADFVVTAHTASDQVETVLMRVIRGCGLDGLTGIPCSRDYIRRPLLSCSRQEIETYCQECGVDYVTDETNGGCCFWK